MPSGFTRQLSGTGIALDRGFAHVANQLTLWGGQKRLWLEKMRFG
jgi:hypothetical protein